MTAKSGRRNRTGGGLRIVIRLPLLKQEINACQRQANLPRILIVDDEPAIRRFLTTALDRRRILPASGGKRPGGPGGGRCGQTGCHPPRPGTAGHGRGRGDRADTGMVAGADHRPVGAGPRDRQGQGARLPGPTTT